MFSERVLKGKKILLTGGGTGIGKSLGTRFLELGAEVVICGRREEMLRGTVAGGRRAGARLPTSFATSVSPTKSMPCSRRSG
jgi:NAD(P)-dependent dehydrogenase (short-subunit alcohol dehydrogenase family)